MSKPIIFEEQFLQELSENFGKEQSNEVFTMLEAARCFRVGYREAEKRIAQAFNTQDEYQIFLEKNQAELESKNKILVEALKFYADENIWRTMAHCESDKLSRIRIDANDYDSFGFSENGEASQLKFIGGKLARKTLKELGVER